MAVTYRSAAVGEMERISRFIDRVFTQYVAPEFTPEGIHTFLSSSTGPELRKAHEQGSLILVAEQQGEIVGVIQLRNCNHIARFFVAGALQQKGIGHALFDRALKICLRKVPGLGRISVNASPNAVGAYQAMGFRATGREQTQDGIRSVPMVMFPGRGVQRRLPLES